MSEAAPPLPSSPEEAPAENLPAEVTPQRLIDTSAPFKNVKDAVEIFGAKAGTVIPMPDAARKSPVLAGEPGKRFALLEVELSNAKAEVASLKDEVAKKQAELDASLAALAETENIKKARAELEAEVAESRKGVDSMKDKLAASITREEELKSKLSSVESTQTSSAAVLSDANAKLESAQKKLEATKTELEGAQKELEVTKTELVAAKKQVAEITASLQEAGTEHASHKAAAEAELVATKKQVVEITASLQKAETEHASYKATTEADMEKTKKEISHLTSELATAQAKYSTAESRIKELEVQAETLKGKLVDASKEVEIQKSVEEQSVARNAEHRAMADKTLAGLNVSEGGTVTLTEEEVENLKRGIAGAEDSANRKIDAALAQMAQARQVEHDSQERMEKMAEELEASKKAEQAALKKAQSAETAKALIEAEWRKLTKDGRRKSDATQPPAPSPSPSLISHPPASAPPEQPPASHNSTPIRTGTADEDSRLAKSAAPEDGFDKDKATPKCGCVIQ